MQGNPDLPDLRVYDGPEWDAAMVKLALVDAGIEAVSDSSATLGSRHLHSTVFIRKASDLARARGIVDEYMKGRA